MKQVTYSKIRMPEQHPWATINHDRTSHLFHILPVAVGRTLLTGWFLLPVGAFEQTKFCKCGKRLAFVAYFLATITLVMSVTVDSGHSNNCFELGG